MDIPYLLFSFQGRIRRLHYWLTAICAGVVLGVIASVLVSFSGVMVGRPNPIALALLAAIYVVDIWIGLALGVKRCHDRDKSGWFLLIGLIPLIGQVWLLIDLGFLDGTPGPNRFGPSPKGLGGVAPLAV
jgi:uncharacterized membrane protein YhaH (DUF805 family)